MRAHRLTKAGGVVALLLAVVIALLSNALPPADPDRGDELVAGRKWAPITGLSRPMSGSES